MTAATVPPITDGTYVRIVGEAPGFRVFSCTYVNGELDRSLTVTHVRHVEWAEALRVAEEVRA
jgi:hypothetical protein